MKSNPPIRGHHLLNEGRSYRLFNHRTGSWSWSEGCQCGAKPDLPYSPSVGEMKRWHRTHKDEIRSKVAS